MSGSRAVKRGRRRRVVARRARMVEVRDHEEKKVARRLSRDSAVVVFDMLDVCLSVSCVWLGVQGLKSELLEVKLKPRITVRRGSVCGSDDR